MERDNYLIELALESAEAANRPFSTADLKLEGYEDRTIQEHAGMCVDADYINGKQFYGGDVLIQYLTDSRHNRLSELRGGKWPFSFRRFVN